MSVHPRAYPLVESHEFVLADGKLIFRKGWQDSINNPKSLFSGKPLNP
jgi:hypothetical protein